MKYLLSIYILLSFFSMIKSQEETPKKFEVEGYISNVQTLYDYPAVYSQFFGLNQSRLWISDNFFHNRLNFHWYPSKSFTGSLQLRNRFFYGDMVRILPDYKILLDTPDQLVNLSHTWEFSSFALNLLIDRAYIKYVNKKFELTAGRQRINWGITNAWNSNDVFNTYSYFDFDYPERPGSDAIRAQYYLDYASSVEAAVKSDSAGNITAGGLVRFNKWEYDFQFIGGYYNSTDIFAGIGWTGYIKNVGFKGEATYFHPAQQILDTSGLIIASIGTDYVFSNSLFLNLEILLSNVENPSFSQLFNQLNAGQGVKNLAYSNFSVLVSASYPITPLLNGTLSSMYMAGINGFFIGPSLTYSLGDNLDMTALLQTFGFELEQPGKTTFENLNTIMLRFKYNF